MKNYWLERALIMVEKEVVLVKSSPETKSWYDRMPTVLPIIWPDKKQPTNPNEFVPKVGVAHHLRYTRFGIEAVLKTPKRYMQFEHYVLHDKINQPISPFWVILYRN